MLRLVGLFSSKEAQEKRKYQRRKKVDYFGKVSGSGSVVCQISLPTTFFPNFAKVDVESSNLFTRSILFQGLTGNRKPYFFVPSQSNGCAHQSALAVSGFFVKICVNHGYK